MAVAGAGLALGALAAGGMAVSIDAAKKFESAMADVQKVTSKGVAGQVKRDIMALAEEIPIAQGELATLAEQAGKFGIQGSKNIRKFVKTVGEISSATGLAAEEAGKRFAKIAGALDMPISRIGDLGNAVNVLADSMKTDASEITDTANRASNVLGQQFGLGEDAVLALSASMNEVSSSSRIASGHLKRAAEALMDPKKVGDIAGALGMQVSEFRRIREESPQKALDLVAKKMAAGGKEARDLSSTLGTQATRAFSLLGGQLGRTEEAQKRVNQQFGENTSLQREMGIRTGTTEGKMQLLKNRFNNIAITVGDALLPYLNDLLEWVSAALTDFSDFISEVDSVRGAFQKLGSWLSGDGGTQLAQGFDDALTTGVTAAKNVRTKLLGTGGGSGLIPQTITGIGNFLEARGASLIKSAAETLWDANVQAAKDMANALFGRGNASIIDRLIGDLADFLKSDGFKMLSKAAGKALGKAIRGAAIEVYNLVTGNESSILKSIALDFASYLINDAPGDLLEAAKIAFGAIWQAAKGLYEGLIGKSLFPEMITDIANWLKNAGKKAVKKAFGAVVGGAESAIKSIDLSPVEDAVKGVIDTANDALSALRNIPSNISTTHTVRKKTVFEDSSATRNVSDGGSGSGSGMLTPFQHGGIVSGPTPALIGEAGPEAIAPLDKLPSLLAAAAHEAGGGSGGPRTVVKDFEIHANSRAEGREAARGLDDELRSRNFNS